MDNFSRATLAANKVLTSSRYLELRKQRYASFDSGAGVEFEAGKLSLEKLAEIGASVGVPGLTSGKQELYEAIINQAL